MSSYINLPLSGLEAPLSEMEELVQDNCHRFAEEVLRPVSSTMDEMSPEETVAPDSPLWQVLEQAGELGLSVKALLELEPQERSRLLLIAAEELAWGDGGLAGIILVNQMPALYSALAGNMEMVDYCDGKLGCWGLPNPITAVTRWMPTAACRQAMETMGDPTASRASRVTRSSSTARNPPGCPAPCYRAGLRPVLPPGGER